MMQLFRVLPWLRDFSYTFINVIICFSGPQGSSIDSDVGSWLLPVTALPPPHDVTSRDVTGSSP